MTHLVVVLAHSLLRLVPGDGHHCGSRKLQVSQRCVSKTLSSPHVIDTLSTFNSSMTTENLKQLLNRRHLTTPTTTGFGSNWFGTETLCSLVVVGEKLLTGHCVLHHVLESTKPTPNIAANVSFGVSTRVHFEFYHNFMVWFPKNGLRFHGQSCMHGREKSRPNFTKY